jgi:hypothetical protein
MTVTARTSAASPPSTDPLRRTSLLAGLLYLATFVSIPSLVLYQGVLDPAAFLRGAGSDSGVLWGVASEVVVAWAGIGTAVVLYPVARRQSETAALGLVAARVVEAALIVVGAVSLLSIVSLRQDVVGTPGADPASLVTAGHTLAAVYDRTFLLSQSLIPALNALLLGSVLYRSGLVPRILPAVGLVGAPLLLASDVAVLFGLHDRVAATAALAALPIAAWELSLGVYLTVKGFRPSAVAALPPAPGARAAVR